MADRPTTKVWTRVPMPDGKVPTGLVGKPVLNTTGGRIGKVTAAEEDALTGYARVEILIDVDDEDTAQMFQGLPPWITVDYDG